MRWLILARTNALKRTHKFTREALKYMGFCSISSSPLQRSRGHPERSEGSMHFACAKRVHRFFALLRMTINKTQSFATDVQNWNHCSEWLPFSRFMRRAGILDPEIDPRHDHSLFHRRTAPHGLFGFLR